MNVNSNRFTASSLVDRALDVADISNTDFLSYNEKTKYLNDAFRNVYQTIINYNLNVFTVDANLVGSGGIYKLPFDCYQIKSVKNPYTGREVPRKADSQGALGGYYEIVNDTIRLGPTVGPIMITYWRKPFFLSIPNKTIETSLDINVATYISSCKNSILYLDSDSLFHIYNCISDSDLQIESTELIYNASNTYVLGNSFIIEKTNSTVNVYNFTGKKIGEDSWAVNAYFILSDDGLVYYGIYDETSNKYSIYYPLNTNPIKEIEYEENAESMICIDNEFYQLELEEAFPIGIFDDRPAYVDYDRNLHLINPDGSEIIEHIDIPVIGGVIPLQYGFLGIDGKLYSNIPDTYLDFPNNLYYDVISYDLAVRFLCKQNADSSGVENLNTNAWNQLTASIDQSADYPRIKLVRR